MGQEKYKSKDNDSPKELPVPMPLYDDISKGNVDFLLQAFHLRKEALLKQIRKGSNNQQSFLRWQACVAALEAACDFLNGQKAK